MSVGQADQILQKLWDSDARVWDRWWVPIFERFAHDLVQIADLSRGQIILDIGTGTGVAARQAAKRVLPGGIVVGVDRSTRMIELAKSRIERTGPKNVSFLSMHANRLLFPGEIFDGAISNCGISYPTFPRTVSEVFRVLRRGCYFTFSDWHLIDVPAHRIFSEVLQEYRTANPSDRLRVLRSALASLERLGNRYYDSLGQAKQLKIVGFEDVKIASKTFKVTLKGIGEYLKMRFERAAVKQELLELSADQRAKLLRQLRESLRPFIRNGRFAFDWKLTFVRAKKAG